MEPICMDCGECRETVTMNARILRVSCCALLVCCLCSCQEVLVRTNDAGCFQVGQCVCIEYNGEMTKSIPPQINALCIRPLNSCGC